MLRAILALIGVPLCVSLVFGQWFPVVMVFLLLPILCAIPLFLLFGRRGWLRCWQVTAAGLAIGVAFAVPMIGDGLYARISGPSQLAQFAALGAAIAWAFWWIGLFRNPLFAGVTGTAVRWPLVLAILPALLWATSRLYEPASSAAVVLELSSTRAPDRMVQVRLAHGQAVEAETAVQPLPTPGNKVLVESRRRLWPTSRYYWLVE